MKIIVEQAWIKNDAPVNSDANQICYPSVNTCLTMTFGFEDLLVGIHLGQTMGKPRTDFLQPKDLTGYMKVVKRHIAKVWPQECWGVFVLGALETWKQHPCKSKIVEGVFRWAGGYGIDAELKGNPEIHAYTWADDKLTANIYVNNNSDVDKPFRFFVSNNKIKGGRLVDIDDGNEIKPQKVYWWG